MKTIKTLKDLSLKSGIKIPKGSTLTFVRPSESDSVGIFEHNGVEIRMRYRSVLKTPSMAKLEQWCNDSICKSVFGAQVEPDGYGTHGEPSWLLAMGMI